MIPPRLQGALWRMIRDRAVMAAGPRWGGMEEGICFTTPLGQSGSTDPSAQQKQQAGPAGRLGRQGLWGYSAAKTWSSAEEAVGVGQQRPGSQQGRERWDFWSFGHAEAGFRGFWGEVWGISSSVPMIGSPARLGYRPFGGVRQFTDSPGEGLTFPPPQIHLSQKLSEHPSFQSLTPPQDIQQG
ncbi:hypothetical protein DUI87_22332 [Hirundo rustica rustica]|uniref:Uncharacterized protein n=1 Tax=Hirundo rustica rustica TaxID=333673 RepID=A0A3M0JIV1_HIRRU|nr:hypothetical protein DUI87_22332 [Hirundo rustica rustica]